MIQCPKCKTVNPKIKWWMGCCSGEACNEVVKTYLFGLIKIKCNHTLYFYFDDGECDENVIYVN